ncbi:MAG: YraN family protein [Desulfobulbus propionicus]|nr:MAG: YraN family protein [Desulfobulbus propionicus]
MTGAWNRKVLPKTGTQGEELACERLQGAGYVILERNYRRPFGEVDIIARQDGVVCFIEVKTRRSRQYGDGFAAVHSHKQRRLSRIALDYLARNNLLHSPARFDVVSIFLGQGVRPKVQLLQNAFEFIEP